VPRSACSSVAGGAPGGRAARASGRRAADGASGGSRRHRGPGPAPPTPPFWPTGPWPGHHRGPGAGAPRGRPTAKALVTTLRPVASRTLRVGEEPPVRRRPAGIVGDGPPLPRGAQRHGQPGFGHLNPDTTWHVTPTHSCLPDLAHTGSMAPDNCTGSGSPGRDDPRDAPVSLDQGSIGLSRPGHCVMGILTHHPLKIQGYWASAPLRCSAQDAPQASRSSITTTARFKGGTSRWRMSQMVCKSIPR
jgi:hypothetical protein